MNDNHSTGRMRYVRAGVAGGVAGIVLAGIVAGTVPWSPQQYDPPNHSPNPLEPWIALGTIFAIFGAGMGIAGSARRITFLATAAGAVAFALFAWTTALLPASDDKMVAALQMIREQTWALAAFVAVLSITSSAGAFAAGTAHDDGRGAMQFSLGELLLVFLPFAVFMGYLGHIAPK